MAPLRWVDKTQPQTLMLATILMYVNAVFGIIDRLFLAELPLGAILVLGQVGAALGIANEKRYAYRAGVALIALWLPFIILSFGAGGIISLMIYGAMLALLLHPQSRSYQKIWFR